MDFAVQLLRGKEEWSLLINVSNICVCELGTGHIIMSSYKLKCQAANRLGIYHGHLSVLMTFFACQTINYINLHNLSQSLENNGIFMGQNEWSQTEKYA